MSPLFLVDIGDGDGEYIEDVEVAAESRGQAFRHAAVERRVQELRVELDDENVMPTEVRWAS